MSLNEISDGASLTLSETEVRLLTAITNNSSRLSAASVAEADSSAETVTRIVMLFRSLPESGFDTAIFTAVVDADERVGGTLLRETVLRVYVPLVIARELQRVALRTVRSLGDPEASFVAGAPTDVLAAVVESVAFEHWRK